MTWQDLNYQLLFEHSPDILLVLLPDAPRFTMVAATNSRLATTLMSREQTIGVGLFEAFPDNPDDSTATGVNNLRQSLERVLATRMPDTMAVQQYDIRRPDGGFEIRYWSPKNLPVLNANGEIQYILHRVEDVTDLVQASELGKELRNRHDAMEREVITRSRELAAANNELRAANLELSKLDNAKTAFFSNISHEFRTPLTLMLGPIEDALNDAERPLPAEQRQRVQLAYNNALRLLKLVNALLDFSRLEAGRLQAHYAPLDISCFTAELAGMFQSAAEKAGIALKIDCPRLSTRVWVDRDMWEKIVPNLVSNALKFTLQGQITVSIREEHSQIVLTVADTGIGIPAEELPKIFDRFHRVASAHGRTHEGTGIGLSLVRELTALHGGTVSVESRANQGSTFCVAIPKGYTHLPADSVSLQAVDPRIGRDARAHVTEAAHWNDDASVIRDTIRTAALKASAARPHVLVVDDNADLRQYLTALLAPLYEVATASDGVAALEALQIRLPELVVSDVMMPRLDGFGLVKKMRADPVTASVPVILLSARAGEESAIDGLEAGADDYLIKPFSARELLARVRTHIQLAQTRRAWIAELERTNRELDAFSYSVSHDLRAPLRAIEGFSRALAEDCAASLTPQALGYLKDIGKGVARMGALIEALLNLARITRTSIKHELVDLSSLARTVAVELQQIDPQRNVTVDIASGLLAHGDPSLLNVVLVNLLSNAWKFTAQRQSAHIEFGRSELDPPTFFVRDNGAGFDMAHASQLFAPFRRLHAHSEFEGTGVGLATVQRIITRHGGQIRAESAVDQGACFFFTLPD